MVQIPLESCPKQIPLPAKKLSLVSPADCRTVPLVGGQLLVGDTIVLLPEHSLLPVLDLGSPVDRNSIRKGIRTAARKAMGEPTAVLAALNADQLRVHELLFAPDRTQPLLVTGRAGSGKSFLQTSIILRCRQLGRPTWQVGPTWMSVLTNAYGASTIHRFCHLKPDSLKATGYGQQLQLVMDGIRSSVFASKVKAWQPAHPSEPAILIVEEASMLSDQMLTLLLEGLEREFGPHAVQVVIFFDLTQIPPIDPDSRLFMHSPKLAEAEVIVLHANLRQADCVLRDDFLDLLHHVSAGTIGPEQVMILRSRQLTAALTQQFMVSPPRYLFYTNADVNACNVGHFNTLPLESRYAYQALDVGRTPKNDHLFATQTTLADTVYLGLGAEVMFTAGSTLHEIGLPCGVRGRVVGFVASQQAVPLPIVYLFQHQLRVVVHPVEEIVMRHTTCIGHRLQFPLQLAWGVTIHTAQGLTIPGPLVVSLKGCDVPGLLYVALSRATTLANLYVTHMPVGAGPGWEVPAEFQRAGPHPEARAWCRAHNVF